MLQQRGMAYDLSRIKEKHKSCDGCALGKQHRQPFPKGITWRAKKILKLIHTDIIDP